MPIRHACRFQNLQIRISRFDESAVDTLVTATSAVAFTETRHDVQEDTFLIRVLGWIS